MEFVLLVSAVFAFSCTTIVNVASSDQTSNHQHSLPSTTDDTQSGSYFFYQSSEYPKDCRDVQRQCSTSSSSGVYLIKPDGYKEPFEVFCNNDVDTGGWTVIQRREGGFANFNRSWSQYEDGFGFLSSEFWLGNEKLSYLTNQEVYELRVDITLYNGSALYAIYKGFRITDGWSQYMISSIGVLESNLGSALSTCPSNMIYNTCSCQATCDDPNGAGGCNNNCLGSEGCNCPTGFLMHGSDCIPTSDCGCFIRDENLVIPNGETYVNDDCTQKCSCSNNRLSCEDDYRCSAYAVCDINAGVRQCSCNEGYGGDGLSCESLYEDCKDVYDAGHTQDGVYAILPSGWSGSSFTVYCKMDNGGGWTVFQRRTDDSTSFYKDWTSYQEGFGDGENLWLGNEKLHYMTNRKNYKLRFDVTTSDGTPKYAEYPEFQVESESNNYRLNKLGDRSSGNTGRNFVIYSRGKQFSTFDRDHDTCGNFHCAQVHRSGWWHSDYYCSYCYSSSYCHDFQYSSSCQSRCTDDNLNGVYNGERGTQIFTDYYYNCNIGSVEMKIRPSS
ncbi:uncharacterized protein [Apostichopus japonicus]|uniref:uncharacterized protein n=1 Tax=Stichopus japonicus TaxID=307972 RepID=UPI003AB1A97E